MASLFFMKTLHKHINMAEKKKQSNKELLFSKDADTVRDTISTLRESGSDKDLHILCELYTKTKSENIKKDIYSFFCDLRNQQSTDTVVRLIKTVDDNATLKMLSASTWESRLNYIGHFELFIDLIIHEGFEIAFEAFTLLESFEEKTTDARKESLIKYVKDNIGKCHEENKAFAIELVKIIESYKVN